MTGQRFTDYIRKLTGTDSEIFSDTDILLYANVEKDELSEWITENVSENYFLFGHERDLEADQREYTLPNDVLLHMKRVSAKLDGEEWSLLTQRRKGQTRDPLVTEDDIKSAFEGQEPKFDILDRGIKIYSNQDIIDVPDGLYIDAMIYPEDLKSSDLSSNTDLSVPSGLTTTRLPRATHKVWALRTSIAYKQSRPKAIPLNTEEANIEVYVQRMLNKLKGRNLDESYVPNRPYADGTDY